MTGGAGGEDPKTEVPEVPKPVEVSKNILLIIDPQNDFMDHVEPYEPTLSVPGAKSDMLRLCEFIEKSGDKLHEIHVSLDSHTLYHIAHTGFWNNAVPLDDVEIQEDNKIIQIDKKGVRRVIEAMSPALQEWALLYIKELNSKEGEGKPKFTIWPNHCIIRNLYSTLPTYGWKVEKTLEATLTKWEKNHKGKLFFHEKGTNDLVEMYSIFSAEIPYETLLEDINMSPDTKKIISEKYNNITPTSDIGDIHECNKRNPKPNYNTSFNEVLFNKIMGENLQNHVYVCGEARTHCVKTTLQDMVAQIKKLKKEGKDFPGSLNLIVNFSSDIPLDEALKSSKDSYDEMHTDDILKFRFYEPTNTNEYFEKFKTGTHDNLLDHLESVINKKAEEKNIENVTNPTVTNPETNPG